MEERYTKKVAIPQYNITGKKVEIEDCFKLDKYVQLVKEIKEKSQAGLLSKEEAQFLTFAATRHIKFNYSKIAEIYAKSSETMQRCMERSALILLDLDDAVANGFTEGRAFVDMLKNMSLTNEETK